MAEKEVFRRKNASLWSARQLSQSVLGFRFSLSPSPPRNALFQAAKFVADESVFSPEFLPSARCVAALIVSADIHAFFANPHLLYPILIFSISHYQLSQRSRFIFTRETF